MSSEIVPISAEEGNTIPSSKQPNQLKNWFFTFNNYTEFDISAIVPVFNEICEKYVFQEEVGESGTPHLQGCISLKVKMRWTEFGLSKQIHWEKINKKSTLKCAMLYCCKLDTRVGQVYTKNFNPPAHLTTPVNIISNLYLWQTSMLEDIILKPPDGRTVHWCFDIGGNKGKSAFCKYAYVKHNAITIQGGKFSDIMNIIFNLDMNLCKNLIIDIPRNAGNKISYSSLECILNGMITNTKFETGVKTFNAPNVVVFSNEPPELEKMSIDRWALYTIEDMNLKKLDNLFEL